MLSLFLAITSGILTGLSFDSRVFSYLVWFSLTPFLYILGKSEIKEGIFCSFLFGFFYFLIALFWISQVTVLGLFALLVYLSFYPLVFFLLGRFLLKKSNSLITLGALWVVLELVRENIWCGFGWVNLGYSQYKNSYLIQPADLFGVKFLSFIIVTVNVFIYHLLFIKKSSIKKTVFVFSLIFFCLVYSFYRLHNLKEKDSVAFSLVQPNVSQSEKQNAGLENAIIEKLKILSLKTKSSSLLIYPEAAWPGILDENNFAALNKFSKELNNDMLIGAVTSKEGKFYNSALLLLKDRQDFDIYHKIKIVPFGEYVPLRKYLSFVEALNSIGDITRGKEYKVFTYNGKRFCVLICFEDIFPAFVSRFAKNSDFLINITDDSWFMGEPEASQHLAIMSLRAIENRISIARAANTGISGWVDFRGKVNIFTDKNSRVFFEGSKNFILPLNNERSLYNKWGEVFAFFCILLLFLALKP